MTLGATAGTFDIGLPGMDSYEIARAFRADSSLRHVILVALTGYGQAEDRARALEAGFDHHLVKPIDGDTLQRLVSGAAGIERGSSASSVH